MPVMRRIHKKGGIIMLNVMLGNKLIKGVVSMLISRTVRKKTGCNIDVQINELDMRESGEDIVKVKFDVETMINRRDLEKLINSINEES